MRSRFKAVVAGLLMTALFAPARPAAAVVLDDENSLTIQ
jgi:hypothetical protein